MRTAIPRKFSEVALAASKARQAFSPATRNTGAPKETGPPEALRRERMTSSAERETAPGKPLRKVLSTFPIQLYLLQGL